MKSPEQSRGKDASRESAESILTGLLSTMALDSTSENQAAIHEAEIRKEEIYRKLFPKEMILAMQLRGVNVRSHFEGSGTKMSFTAKIESSKGVAEVRLYCKVGEKPRIELWKPGPYSTIRPEIEVPVPATMEETQQVIAQIIETMAA